MCQLFQAHNFFVSSSLGIKCLVHVPEESEYSFAALCRLMRNKLHGPGDKDQAEIKKRKKQLDISGTQILKDPADLRYWEEYNNTK